MIVISRVIREMVLQIHYIMTILIQKRLTESQLVAAYQDSCVIMILRCVKVCV